MRPRKQSRINRRHVLAGLGGLALAQAAGPALAEVFLDATELGVGSEGDQTLALTTALERAAAQGRPLFLPAGYYAVSGLVIPNGATLIGAQGRTFLGLSEAPGPVAIIRNVGDVTIEGILFHGGATDTQREGGLLAIEQSSPVTISRCKFMDHAGGIGIAASVSRGSIDRCEFVGHREAIFIRDSGGFVITHNSIWDCADGGILIWGSAPKHQDGSIVIGNTITRIGAVSGGNGQHGNGINVFQADRVIVADNQMSDCAFTAVRLNGTNNTQVRGNTCINSGEVAIFSEFAFSGSVIADNIIDGAAQGISITNFDHDGRLAVCSGNIVRNIAERSLVNPDTQPVGIYAEAETAITGNVVETVPGIGIAAGYGPYLRNVLIADNVVRGIHIGIGVTVAAEAMTGAVKISDNLIADASVAGIAGLRWDEMASDDLVRDAGQFSNVSISGNTITQTR